LFEFMTAVERSSLGIGPALLCTWGLGLLPLLWKGGRPEVPLQETPESARDSRVLPIMDVRGVLEGGEEGEG
jgi:hypothetical protein